MKKLLIVFGLLMILIASCITKNESKIWKEKPYEKMFNEISKYYYIKSDTSNGYFSLCDKKTQKEIDGNMEDVTKLKKIIMGVLPFEPYSSFESEYQNNWLEWSASKYDISVMYNEGSVVRGYALSGHIDIWIDLKEE